MVSEMHDSELLHAYGTTGDESAFGELVSRYVDFVYSTALRRLDGESGLAEEVTQTVFLLLARKSRALAAHPSPAGWLYRTACHVAAKARRSEIRRRSREREAALMNTNDLTASDANQILPLLDDALRTLNEPDRMAVLLRFFLKKPMRDVGLALGVSEAAAKMRVSRAVERLREFFVARGIACSTSALAAVLTNESLPAAPSPLTAKIMIDLPAINPPLTLGSILLQTLILMSKTKANVLLIGALAGVGVAMLGINYFDTASESEGGPTKDQPAVLPKGENIGRPYARLTDVLRRNPSAGADLLEDSSPDTQRLRAALAAPHPKGSRFWPDEEVLQAVADFTDRKAAFAVLKAAFAHPERLISEAIQAGADPAQLDKDFVIQRAIAAMGSLGRDVPEVASLLWDLFRIGNFDPASLPVSVFAFSALKTIGFKTADLPELVEKMPALRVSPAMRRFIPQAISDLIARDPMAAEASLGALEKLLSHPDSQVRLSAAGALAPTRLAQVPGIGETLREALAGSESQFDSLSVLCVAESLAGAGEKAAAFVPALLKLAKQAPNEYVRADVLRAVAKIQPNTAELPPEVSHVLATDTLARDLSARLGSGIASMEDLVGLLRLDQQTVTAASKLGELGPAAASAIPVMLQALQGKEEDQRDRIVDAIHKINPEVRVDRVEARAVMDSVIEATVLSGERAHDQNDPLGKLLLEWRMFSTWRTRDEVAAFAKKLAAADATAHSAFVARITQADPTLRDALTQPKH
jgi:RNA polymerase sigma factor (sigma-70 family)